MKIAIIGGGISGNTAAYYLSKAHDVTLFESEKRLGGHTHTHSVELEGKELSVDSGFIVFNDWTYPEFIKILDSLNVDSVESEMSFSVRCERTGLEYSGTNLNTLFSQRKNIFSPSFIGLLRDILRFNQSSVQFLAEGGSEITLGEFLRQGGFGKKLIDYYVVPMGAAIWSTDPALMLEFPARFFLRFLKNHGLLNVNDRPVWRVIKGGSSQYLKAMTKGYKDRICLDSAVERISRSEVGATVYLQDGHKAFFDAVFISTHSDQALAMLENPTKAERETLSAIPYQNNSAVLHRDLSLLPRTKRAWSAWNYHIPDSTQERVGVTYNMKILQRLDIQEPVLVTLNYDHAIDPKKVIKRMNYAHPLFTLEGAGAQVRHGEINGTLNTWYCGAYWRNGFHEDGVVSALNAIEHFEKYHERKSWDLRRAG